MKMRDILTSPINDGVHRHCYFLLTVVINHLLFIAVSAGRNRQNSACKKTSLPCLGVNVLYLLSPFHYCLSLPLGYCASWYQAGQHFSCWFIFTKQYIGGCPYDYRAADNQSQCKWTNPGVFLAQIGWFQSRVTPALPVSSCSGRRDSWGCRHCVLHGPGSVSVPVPWFGHWLRPTVWYLVLLLCYISSGYGKTAMASIPRFIGYFLPSLSKSDTTFARSMPGYDERTWVCWASQDSPSTLCTEFIRWWLTFCQCRSCRSTPSRNSTRSITSTDCGWLVPVRFCQLSRNLSESYRISSFTMRLYGHKNACSPFLLIRHPPVQCARSSHHTGSFLFACPKIPFFEIRCFLILLLSHPPLPLRIDYYFFYNAVFKPVIDNPHISTFIDCYIALWMFSSQWKYFRTTKLRKSTRRTNILRTVNAQSQPLNGEQLYFTVNIWLTRLIIQAVCGRYSTLLFMHKTNATVATKRSLLPCGISNPMLSTDLPSPFACLIHDIIVTTIFDNETMWEKYSSFQVALCPTSRGFCLEDMILISCLLRLSSHIALAPTCLDAYTSALISNALCPSKPPGKSV